MNLELNQLFGENATQDSTSLIIQKSSLIGLVPSVSNKAESLLAAIINTAITYANNEQYLLNIQQWDTVFSQGKITHTFIISEFELYVL